MDETGIKNVHIYIIQLALLCLIGTYNMNPEDGVKGVIFIARYVFYFLIIRGSQYACTLAYTLLYCQRRIDIVKLLEKSKRELTVFTASASILLFFKKHLLEKDFLWIFIAHLIAQYLAARKATINYGAGMACSYVEGYLVKVIPSDGGSYPGFAENIRVYEADENVVFPVKRLFIIVTKSVFCPTDLKYFNKPNRNDLPKLDNAKSLTAIIQDVAGVKGRVYHNSAYKIQREGQPPVYLVGEFASPLNTLHKVLQKRSLYQHLCDVDVDELVSDYCSQLRTTIERSPDYRGNVELVYYDDTDPEQNLGDVLLDKIREIEPNFEEVIRSRLTVDQD